MKKPKPIIGLLAAAVALTAFLQAPEPAAAWVHYAWYAAAACGTLTVLLLLTTRIDSVSRAQSNPRASLVKRLCEVLIFVGAGYCTSVPPGVIKLGGVLPLGWSCAVAALLFEYARLFEAPAPSAMSVFNYRSGGRLALVALATVVQGASGHHDGRVLLWVMTFILVDALLLTARELWHLGTSE